MDRQLAIGWKRALDDLARLLNPLHGQIFKTWPQSYYWSAYQSEWATGNFTGELVTSFKDRPEGVRVKHWVRGNSIKMYDKAGSILRVETTIAKTTDFKVFRPLQNDPNGRLSWRPLRKGVADLHRRAQVSQRSNDNYLEALAAVDDSTPLSQLLDQVSRPAQYRGRRVRALRVGDPDDIALLQAISRGECATAGFRNRDLRALLHPSKRNRSDLETRRLSARISASFDSCEPTASSARSRKATAMPSHTRATSSPPPSSPRERLPSSSSSATLPNLI